ncbi:MAG TPA: hypothetical protein VFR37_21390 [Longimicrobium sp.]|nr:hypothetical protein [Longimicrobium sp.]
MLNLDLSSLVVESFEVNVAGDPSQWTVLAAPPPSDDTECETCDDVYVAAATHERICTTTA